MYDAQTTRYEEPTISTLLHLDSSPLGDRSISRHLSAHYAQTWTAANPGGNVITRDLSSMNIPPVDATWVQAAYTPADARTPELRAALALSDELIAELRSASHCVIGVPMHNFGVPSTLKLWIDQIVRVGETFNYGAGAPVGLLHGISATFITASGGSYGPTEAARSMNFVEPYLRAVFGFIGFADIDVVSAGGASALMSGSIDRETFMQPHLEAIHTRFAA